MRGLTPVLSFVIFGAVALALGAYGAQQPLVSTCGDKQGCIGALAISHGAEAVRQATMSYAAGVVGLLVLLFVANAMFRVARARRLRIRAT